MDKIFNWTSTVIGNCGRIFRRNFRSMGQYFVGTAGDNGA